MGKKLREALVGVFIIAGIALFVILYIWLSGRISLRNTYDVSVYFNDVAGLRAGDPVMVYGLEKGKVTSMVIDTGNVKVTIALDRKIRLPRDSKITIRAISYVGADMYVKITPGRDTDTATVFHGSCETLDIESMIAQFDSLFAAFGNLNPSEFTDIAKNLSYNINRNMNKLVEMTKKPVNKLDNVIDKTEHVVDQLDSLAMMFEKDGTVGKLLTSDELYDEIRETNFALRDLLEDIKENPERYIKIKIF